MTDRMTAATPVTRRRFGTLAGGALASLAFSSACGSEDAIAARDADDGRIAARPRAGGSGGGVRRRIAAIADQAGVALLAADVRQR